MLSSLRLPKLALRVLLLSALVPGLAQAQTQLVHYNPVGAVNEGNLPAQSTAPGITASSLRLVGAVGGNFSGSFHTLGWTNGPAPDPNRYIEFTTNGSFQAGWIRHHWFGTSFGPALVSVRTSLDGFTNDIATATKAGNVSLDIRCLGEISGTITFRLYYYSGSFGLDSSTNAVFIDGGGQQGLKLFDAPPIPNQDCATATHLAVSTPLSATDFFVGDFASNGAGFGEGDNWFTFDIPPYSRVDVAALVTSGDAAIGMTLYPLCNLSFLTFADPSNEIATLSHINTGAAFQSLGLRVFSADLAECAVYDLEIETTLLPCLSDPGDAFDNIFLCSNAVPVQLDTMVTDLKMRADNLDYFSFDLQPGESATASVFFDHDEGDLYLLGFENGCSAIAGSSSTSTNDESMVFTNSTATVQNYAVEVGIDPFTTGACANYSLLVTREVFSTHCSGDGGDQAGCTDCPCSNNAPLGTIGGCVNQNGESARLVASGSSSVTAADPQDLAFDVVRATPMSFAILLSGDNLAPQNPANPCFGTGSGLPGGTVLDGMRCAVGSVLRHGTRPIDANGNAGLTTNGWGGSNGPTPNLASQGNFAPGQTRYFQAFYRTDPDAGCGTGQNSTQAVEVSFRP